MQSDKSRFHRGMVMGRIDVFAGTAARTQNGCFSEMLDTGSVKTSIKVTYV